MPGYFIEDKNMFRAVMFLKKILNDPERNTTLDRALEIVTRNCNVDAGSLVTEYENYTGTKIVEAPDDGITCPHCKRPYEIPYEVTDE